MQYILTEDEYKLLIAKQRQRNQDEIDDLQHLCTLVATHMPVEVPWEKKEKPEPWGCILTEDTEWWCDRCPVEKYCPNQRKAFSK